MQPPLDIYSGHIHSYRGQTSVLVSPPVPCSELRHPNVMLLMAKCCGPRQQDMFLALEPLQTGSLYQLLHREQGRLSRLEAVGLVSDITRGGCSFGELL